MPLYDFSCDQCGTQFEKQFSFREDPVGVSCPNGHHKVHRVYSAPWIVFKGSGWYKTDYRSDIKAPGAADSSA